MLAVKSNLLISLEYNITYVLESAPTIKFHHNFKQTYLTPIQIVLLCFFFVCSKEIISIFVYGNFLIQIFLLILDIIMILPYAMTES